MTLYLTPHGLLSFFHARNFQFSRVNKKQIVNIETGVVVLRSHAVLDTTNVHYFVQAGATLIVRAPALDIKRVSHACRGLY